jgi:hypothetical protein
LDFGLFTAPGVYKCKAKADSSEGTCMVEMNDSAVVTISGYVPGQAICIVSYDNTLLPEQDKMVQNGRPAFVAL